MIRTLETGKFRREHCEWIIIRVKILGQENQIQRWDPAVERTERVLQVLSWNEPESATKKILRDLKHLQN